METTYYSHIPEELPTSKFSFFKSVSLLAVFVILTPLTLAISVFALVFLTSKTVNENSGAVLAAQNTQPANIFAALPDTMPTVQTAIGTEDARVAIIRNYLRKYNSPMADKASYIVQVADETGIDFRLITAIAQQESNLCKRIPEGSYNCWGWGIHSRGTLGFSSFEEGIRTVSEGLKREYINKGYTTPEEIMSKYTPSSNGSWARGVRIFLEDLE